MIREHVFSDSTPSDKYFRWRGGIVSRLENLSDVVFAICLTMLVAAPISRSFNTESDELLYSIKMLPAFLVCFLILIWIWYQHYKFFRRFGLGDWLTVALNTLLLFLVVAYTLPLRFVGSMVLDGLVGLDKQIRVTTDDPVGPEFSMAFYSGGFVAIFLLLACLHWWAWAKRGALSLDELERYVTKTEIRSHLLTASVGILSLVLVWLLNVPVAGMIYCLLAPIHMIHGYMTGKRSDQLLQQDAERRA